MLVPFRWAHVGAADTTLPTPPTLATPGRGNGYQLFLYPALTLLWGVLAGLTNEHTGPAFIVGLTFYLAWRRRHRQPLAPWMLTAVLGIVIGYGLLYWAPGQQVRYNGIAQATSVWQTVLQRGLIGNLLLLLICAAPAVLIALFMVLAGYFPAQQPFTQRPTGPLTAPPLRPWYSHKRGLSFEDILRAAPSTAMRFLFHPVIPMT